ncbi:MAG: TIGR02099 family protein [Burkholderiales bacterium]|nr:TIGR02099 family protein [Burkholderiales bacterium]
MAPTLAIRLLRLAATAIVALVVVALATLLAVRYVIFPRIDDYRIDIAQRLTAQLGQPVTIDAIAAGWDGWNPMLAVSGVAIRDRANADGPPVLLLPRVDATIAWTSLLALDLRLRELSIERPQLSVRRDRAGRLHVAGIEIDPEGQADDTRFTDWLLRQREIVVRDALLTWNDELRGVPQLVLDRVMFRLERGLTGHHFGLVGTPPSAMAAPIDFRGEVSASSLKDWREAKGSFYVRLDYADVALWREWIPLLKPVETGRGALRMWFDFAQGRATDVTADLELTDVSVRAASNLPQLDLDHLAGRVTWKADGGRRELATHGLTFRTRSGQALAPAAVSLAMTEGPDGAITGGRVAFDRLDVAPLSALAEHLPFPEAWRRDFATYALRGSVTDGKFGWEGPPDAPTRFAGSGAFTRFGISASAAMPGADGVSGSFTFDEKRGDLKLDGRDIRVSLPRVFAEPVLLDVASGRVGWTRADGRLRVTFDDVRFATPHSAGTASGSWQGRERGPGVLDLKAQLVRAEAQHLYRYLPLTLDPNVRDWLRASIRQGTATDVKIAVAGDLADFPFADSRKGQFLVTFKVAGVTLDYADGWPEISGIDGEVRFDGPGMAVRATRGRIFDAVAGPVKADIPDLGADHPLLTIEGEATGATGEFLRFVEKSPVAGWIGHFTDGVTATGAGKLALRFTLPLSKADGVEVAGDYAFLDNEVRIPGVPALAHVGGHLVFTEKATTSRDFVAQALGGPVKIAVTTGDGHVRIAAAGTASVAAVRADFDTLLLQRVSGSAEWRLNATTASGGTTWTLESDLKGVGIEAPAPIGKGPEDVAALRVERREVPGRTAEDVLTVDYRRDLKLVLHRTLAKDAATVDRALLLLGGAVARGGTADRPGLWLRGQVAELDVDEWLALYRKESARTPAGPAGTKPGGGLELMGLDLTVARMDVFGRLLRDFSVAATRADADWHLRLSGREIEGTAVWRAPTPSLPNGRVMARLARLVPPGPDELHPPRSEVAAAEKARNTWPELDITANAFVTRGGNDLGRAELLAQPSGPDWRITKFALTNPAGRIDASGWWRIAREHPRTELDFAMTTADAGEFLVRFGYPVAVKSAPSEIKGTLAWAGAPSDFDYPSLTGQFTLQTGAGQFTKIDPGIGKLLGVLSLQALPRRITLDFRDVFSEGFAFDDITGSFRIDRGLMRTGDLRLEGPAAQVAISGEIDLARETQALDVRVKPALSSTFSAGAAVLFIANPLIGAAVGAGTLLAQKLLDNPLGQIFSYDYRVTGSWSDPHVERVAAKPVGASAAAAPEASTQ